MDRHFILPLSIAAALHGGLLFGFRTGPAPRPTPKPTPAIEIKTFPNPPEPELPEVEIVADAPEPKGRPDAPMPSSPDLPVVATGPFTVPVQTFIAFDTKNIPRIEAGPPGLPEGVESDLRRSIVGSTALDDPPRTRLQVPPQYPFEAKRAGRSGEVFVEFTVDENGRVLNPRVVRSSDRAFEEATLQAVLKWRFEPGRVHGRIVRFKMGLPVRFHLDD